MKQVKKAKTKTKQDDIFKISHIDKCVLFQLSEHFSKKAVHFKIKIIWMDKKSKQNYICIFNRNTLERQVKSKKMKEKYNAKIFIYESKVYMHQKNTGIAYYYQIKGDFWTMNITRDKGDISK